MDIVWKQTIIDGCGPWATYDIHDNEFTFDIINSGWEFHRHAIENYIPYHRRNLVVQGGGWQGVYPRLLANTFKKVYTFEPHPDNFKCLTINCDLDHIIKMQCALNDVNTQLTLEETLSTGQHRVTHDFAYPMALTGRTLLIQSVSIDSLNLPECDFIMLDLENHEPKALLGAVQTISKFKPVISLEVSYFEESNKFYDDFLVYFGYKLICKSHNDYLYAHPEFSQ
jgi:FkbM family methyltransferase